MSRAASENEASDKLTLTITVAPGGVSFENNSDRWTGSFELVIAQHTRDDRWMDTAGGASLGFTNERHDRVVKAGLSFDQPLVLRDDADRLHIAVRDPVTDAMGSLVIPVREIRAAPRQ